MHVLLGDPSRDLQVAEHALPGIASRKQITRVIPRAISRESYSRSKGFRRMTKKCRHVSRTVISLSFRLELIDIKLQISNVVRMYALECRNIFDNSEFLPYSRSNIEHPHTIKDRRITPKAAEQFLKRATL
jgi:hypothetical protein